MKRLIACFLAAAMLLSLCACGGRKEPVVTTTGTEENTTVPTGDATEPTDGETEPTVQTPVTKPTAGGEVPVAPTTTKKPTTTATVPTEPPELEAKSGPYTYTVSDGKATITDCERTDSELVIPSQLGGYPVVAIDNRAFQKHTELASVTIPAGVEELGVSAFNGCSFLKTLNVNGVPRRFSNKAFQGCTALVTVNVANLGAWASIEFGTDANPLLNGAVLYCQGAEVKGDITLPSGTSRVGNAAFYNCKQITGITLPNSVAEIGPNAFYGCEALATVNFGSGVKLIGKRAFYQCKALTELTLPSALREIGAEAFHTCSALKVLNFPAKVETVGAGAFQGCGKLKTVNITDLAAWCRVNFLIDSLKSANPTYYSRGGLYLNGELVEGKVVVPKATGRVGEAVFYGYTHITDVVFEEGITALGGYIFPSCPSLKTAVIPNTVTGIGSCTFYDCDLLEEITIPNSVKSIGWSTFYLCDGLATVKLGNGVKEIGGAAFKSCPSLTKVQYAGSKADREKISIGKENEKLTSATWTYAK